jgi:hypothetical protein
VKVHVANGGFQINGTQKVQTILVNGRAFTGIDIAIRNKILIVDGIAAYDLGGHAGPLALTFTADQSWYSPNRIGYHPPEH